MSVSYGGDSITFADGSTVSNGWTGFKNRIINGAMVIDQRYNGTANTIVTNDTRFVVDRWGSGTYSQSNGTLAHSVQQVSDAPTGFTNSLKITVTTAGSSANTMYLFQKIEGYNFADLNFGAADAQAFTLSYWVKSSVAGTYANYFRNGDSNRVYLTDFTISQANTWEKKTVIIPGDTSGTWLKTNGGGIQVSWSLSGSASQWAGSTLNQWIAGNYFATTSQTNIGTTLGATFQITGVQVEKGSTASSFEWRPYGTELQLCQRYFQKSYNAGVVPGTVTSQGAAFARAYNTDPYLIDLSPRYVCSMRAIPTVTFYSTNAGTKGKITGNGDVAVSTVSDSGENSLGFPLLTSGPTVGQDYRMQYTADAEF